MDIVTGVLWAFGIVVFIFGLQAAAFIPLTVYYEIWKRRFFARFGDGHTPSVSVIVPAYNEENTIARSVGSILQSDYPDFHVIIVNDGSTDTTEEIVRPFLSDPRVSYIAKPNGGKASALNKGFERAHGDIIFYTDADSLFQAGTIRNIARWFVDPNIHAVCGDDTPLQPETPLQKFLTITTHIGTGFVRRAFSVLNVLPVISGNCGAVRREWLGKVNGFSEVWGEDLDLTFKLHRAKARIIYDWEALVCCEVPRSLAALWKQRVRWIRSFIKISFAHRGLFFNPQYFPFSWYLPLNAFNLIAIPVLQSCMALLLPLGMSTGLYVFRGVLDVLLFSGFLFFNVIAAYSMLIDRKPGHMKYLPLYGWLIIPVSYFFNGVVLFSIYKEARRSEEVWEKIERRNLEALRARGRRSVAWFYPVGAAVSVFALISLFTFFNFHERSQPPLTVKNGLTPLLTVATHFDAWQSPEKAMTSVFDRKHSSLVGSIGVGAGRYEWNYFRWKNHEQTWSNHQKGSDEDLLREAIRLARKEGRGVVAIVDFYAPNYIAQHPGAAATGSDGIPSSEQVCFTELVRGAYGAHLKEMISYLAQEYPLEGISLTELDYHRYCYDERCRVSYTQTTGNSDWPRTFLKGEVNKENHSVGEWRSSAMSGFLHELADSAHTYGKKLYIDVPVDYENMSAEGLYHGLHYPELLTFADALIVWDYFYLEGRSPATSEYVARFFSSRYDPGKVILSIGLWGKEATVSPEELASAVHYGLRGGARQIWVTPGHLISDAHWEKLTSALGAN